MASYPEFIELAFKRENPVSGDDSDIDKFPESLPRYFLTHFTKEKAKVFDPFSGHGTTAFVAEEMGRIPYGIEADRGRYEWSAGQLAHWQNMRHDDAANMLEQGFPKMDFCITSPPYMMMDDAWNPLCPNGDKRYGGYAGYLKRLHYIFSLMPQIMKKNALVVVQCDNIQGKVYTPLVSGFSAAISESLTPVGETIVKWKKAPEGYPLTHCLLFRNR